VKKRTMCAGQTEKGSQPSAWGGGGEKTNGKKRNEGFGRIRNAGKGRGGGRTTPLIRGKRKKRSKNSILHAILKEKRGNGPLRSERREERGIAKKEKTASFPFHEGKKKKKDPSPRLRAKEGGKKGRRTNLKKLFRFTWGLGGEKGQDSCKQGRKVVGGGLFLEKMTKLVRASRKGRESPGCRLTLTRKKRKDKSSRSVASRGEKGKKGEGG